MSGIDPCVFSSLCVRKRSGGPTAPTNPCLRAHVSVSLSLVQGGVISSRGSECSLGGAPGPKLCALITHLMSHWEGHWVLPLLPLSVSHTHTLFTWFPLTHMLITRSNTRHIIIINDGSCTRSLAFPDLNTRVFICSFGPSVDLAGCIWHRWLGVKRRDPLGL